MKFLKRSTLLNLTLKEKRINGRTKSLTVFSYFGVAIVIVSFFLGYVGIRMQVLKTGYDILKLREQKDRLFNFNKHLEVEWMSLVSLTHIEDRGNSLSLLIPSKDKVIFVVETRLQKKRFF